MSERIGIIDPSEGESTLIRGNGLLAVLGQFTSWARRDPEGVRIVTGKLPLARQALEAAGWILVAPDDPLAADAAPARKLPLPLPECEICQAPYGRGHSPAVRERCVRCGHPLRLVQQDPNADLSVTSAPRGRCPGCGRGTHPRWRYCRCGLELDAPELTLDGS